MFASIFVHSLSLSEVFGDSALKDLWFTLAGADMFRDHLDAHDPKQKDDIKKILLLIHQCFFKT